MNRSVRGNLLRAPQAAVVHHQHAVGRSRRANRHANQDALILRVDAHPNRVPVLPVDGVPERLDLLADLDRFRAPVDVDSFAVDDHGPFFADVYAVHRGRAHLPRHF